MVVHLVGAVLGTVAGQTEGLVRRELVDGGVDSGSDSDAGVSGLAGGKWNGIQMDEPKRKRALWH